jgi:sarcosine oxidase
MMPLTLGQFPSQQVSSFCLRSSQHVVERQNPLVRADVIVVGLGAMGSAVTLRLAERGLRVIGLDRFFPPHDHGSTHGETRITRLAIGEGSSYVPLVRRSHELWREIERDTSTRLLRRTGGLVIGDRDNAFLEQTRAVATEHGIAHENLSNAELMRRFPMFSASSDTEAYFEPEAGLVDPEAALKAQLSLARRAGAQLRLGEAVVSWTASSDGVAVSTTAGTVEARELALCAGAWITKLVPQSDSLFAIYPQLQHWFPIRCGFEGLRKMPVFVWETSSEKEEFVHLTGFYGFPALDGREGGVKLATETYDTTVDPDELPLASAADAATRFYERHLAHRFPWVDAQPLRTIRCLYTTARGSRFIIDRHPAHANVMIVSACSGHGFKHSPAIGEAVAQFIVSGCSDIDLRPFQICSSRPWG